MLASTTSSTNFKMRVGGNIGTTTVNGVTGVRYWGGRQVKNYKAKLVESIILIRPVLLIDLSGAVSNFQSFSVVGNGNTCYYLVEDTTNNIKKFTKSMQMKVEL